MENGKILVVVHGKQIEIQIRNGKFVKPKELTELRGRGTALKPANEPILIYSKGASLPDSLVRVPFFYCAKASRKERDFGCKNLYWHLTEDGQQQAISKDEYDRLLLENEARKDEEGFKAHRVSDGNCHPTVKSLGVCRGLIKSLLTKKSIVLDCFCGSGSLLGAAILEGHYFVGIDNDPNSVTIARARTTYFERTKSRKLPW